jgi:hypothetical protein
MDHQHWTNSGLKLLDDKLPPLLSMDYDQIEVLTKSDIDTSAYNNQQQFPYLLIVGLHIGGRRNLVNS